MRYRIKTWLLRLKIDHVIERYGRFSPEYYKTIELKRSVLKQPKLCLKQIFSEITEEET